MEKTSPKKRVNMTKTMILLLVFLVAVIGVAVSGCDQQENIPTTVTDPSGTTAATTVTTSQPTVGTTVTPQGLTVEPLFDVDNGTTAESVEFAGTSDPGENVLVNGKGIVRNADGSFRCEVPLTVGSNEIVFTHKDQTETFTVERRYVVDAYSPMGEETFNSGATIGFKVFARKGSTVSAKLNGQTVNLKESVNQQGSGAPEGFRMYEGSLKLTNTNTTDLDLGKITYTATCDGITETYESGTITCLKTTQIQYSDPSVTPDYGDYINVGSGYIVEVVAYAAETFDGKTRDDYSHPTNNELPAGTVDYCSANVISSNDMQYILLRCGRRIYLEKRNTPDAKKTKVADCYIGTLPDHNEIGFASMEEVGHHTILTLDCLWKAPFYFELAPQNYAYPNGGSDRSYQISNFTATHVDITFCYATKFEGTVQIPENNPLFKSAELIVNKSDCTLRLHLKETGGFYGWESYYNDQDQLCFRFLNPVKVTAADNAYGADLTGVTVMIDVGHGGYDGGASRKNNSGVEVEEAERNLTLAKKLKAQLESVGATVILNRTDDVTLRVDERLQMLKQAAPDICIAVHHNAANVTSYRGFEAYYYHPFSMRATNLVNESTKQCDVYERTYLAWHVYFTCRQTACPVVLTENGYLSNPNDLNNISSDSALDKKAAAIAKGVANYFLQISE